ncbi:phage tail protein [Yokenella regensburgei]|uniref:phage tail protein n=1 Tax=Yokenella regensburgei TaxID=158877 RepID=UPI003ED9EC93
MATKYFALLTNIGAAKLANATALGAQVEITQMAVGDGNGVLPTPNPAQTALTHELRRAQLNMLTIDPVNTNQIIAEQVIPEDVGGWWIREIGLFDKDGDMIAVANCAETYKPLLQEGSGRVQVIRVILIVSSTEAVTLKIDPSMVLATRQYVDDKIIEVKNLLKDKQPLSDQLTYLANHSDAEIRAYLGMGNSATRNVGTERNTVAAGDDSRITGAMQKNKNGSDIENVSLFLNNLGMGNSATRNVGTEQNTVAAGDDSRITGAMQKNKNGADIENVSLFLDNIGVKSAAKKSVGTGAGQIPDMSAFGAQLSLSGYAKLPSGLIQQWMGGNTGGLAAGEARVIELAFPFPSGILAVVPYTGALAAGFNAAVGVKWTGKNQITIYNSSMTQAIADFGYIAYGV